MTQDQHSPVDVPPAMELLEGDSAAASSTPSLVWRIARGTTYGVVLLVGTALLAVSAVPDLARYATFLPTTSGSSCAVGSGSSCTTLDQVKMDSCCPASKAAVAATSCPTSAGSCCATSDETLTVATSSEVPPCCASISRASLLASTSQQPIDAGSLLATTDEPADQQSEQQGAELEPDDDRVEE